MILNLLNLLINGLIVKEYCEFPSNFRSQYPLDQYLKDKDIPGLADIDTRKLTRKIRRARDFKRKNLQHGC